MSKISIIVPVYKVEKYLERCLDSIIAQTFTDWECILIDDGSPDNSGKICDEYAKKDERFVVIHQENAGVSVARNAGLDIAKGEYITFVDSDDWVENSFLEEQYNDIISGDYDICICGFVGKGKNKHKVLNGSFSKRLMFSSKGFGGFSFLRIIHRRIIGIEKFNQNITYLEDTDFFYRLFNESVRILWTDKPLYFYENNPSSVTKQIGITPYFRSAIDTLEQLYLKENDKILKKILKTTIYQWYVNLYFSFVRMNIFDGDDFEECKEFLKENQKKILFASKVKFKHKIIFFILYHSKNIRNNFFVKIIQKK